MPYPTNLLPHSSYKILSPLDANHILCRWVRPELNLKDSSGGLAVEAIEESQLPGYSTNKIPPSTPDDVKIAFHEKKFTEDWIEGADPLIPLDKDFFNKNGDYFLFRIKDFAPFTATYPYPADPGAKDNYSFTVSIIHKPLKANYSHCEFLIKFFEIDGKTPADKTPGKKSQSHKLVISEIRRRLMQICKFQLEDFSNLSSHLDSLNTEPLLNQTKEKTFYKKIIYNGKPCLLFEYTKNSKFEAMIWAEDQTCRFDLSFKPFIVHTIEDYSKLIASGDLVLIS
jgi:hypothetical protein